MAKTPSHPPASADATGASEASDETPAPLSKPAQLVLGLGLPSVLALFTMLTMRSFTVDDSFISFRYARNWARGWGLVYNRGEPIEGYTNFLWTLMLGVGIKLGIAPEQLAKVLGAAFCLLAMWAMYRLSDRLHPAGRLPCISTWLVASTTAFAGYAVFGLETSMFAALVLVGTLLMLREEDRKAKIPWSGLVFAAAGLTRPEAPLYLGTMMLFLGGSGVAPLERVLGGGANEALDDGHAAAGQQGGARVNITRDRSMLLFGCMALAVALAVLYLLGGRTMAAAPRYLLGALALALALALGALLPKRLFGMRNLTRGALFVTPVALHMLWRKSFYGRWLPNTFTAKTGNINQQFYGGAGYLEKGLMHEGLAIYLALFGLAAALVWRHREGLAIAAVVLLAGFYVVLVGGDWMPMFRFLAPILPFAYLLVDMGARALVAMRQKVLVYGLTLLALVVAGQRSGRFRRDSTGVMTRERDFWLTAAGGTARWFRHRIDEHGRDKVVGTIAMGDIGRIGYETDFPVLDLLGLVDPVIAKLPGGYTNKVGAGYRNRFFDVQPRYFILISAENDCRHPSVAGSRSLYRDRRFHQQYGESGRVALGKGFHWCIYEHNRFTGRKADTSAPAPRRINPRLLNGPRLRRPR